MYVSDLKRIAFKHLIANVFLEKPNKYTFAERETNRAIIYS